MTTQTAAKSRRLSRKPAKRPDAMAKRQGQSRPQLRDDFFPLFGASLCTEYRRLLLVVEVQCGSLSPVPKISDFGRID